MKNSKGVRLTFCRKIGISEMGLFLKKSKGVSLTFCRKIGISEMGIFLKKATGLALLFAEKSVFLKLVYFWKIAKRLILHFASKAKSVGDHLYLSINLYFCRRPLFAQKQNGLAGIVDWYVSNILRFILSK